jgi:hypothetical protein
MNEEEGQPWPSSSFSGYRLRTALWMDETP